MPTNNSPDFYQQVEEFILRSISEDTLGDRALNNEIGIFLLSLLAGHKNDAAN